MHRDDQKEKSRGVAEDLSGAWLKRKADAFYRARRAWLVACVARPWQGETTLGKGRALACGYGYQSVAYPHSYRLIVLFHSHLPPN